MVRFPSLLSLIFLLVEYFLVVHINLSMADIHGSNSEAATANVQKLNIIIINRRMRFELEQGILPSITADPPADSTTSTPEPSETETETTAAEGPDIRRMRKEHRRSSDKSVAGGGLIIGGLATAIFAAVFCYIRVTRKTDHMGSSSTMAIRGTTRTDGSTTSAAA